MQLVKTFVLPCLLACLSQADSVESTVYEKACGHTSECTVYPNVTQGPDVIWIPFFCNEKNICECPNGWTPLLTEDICIARITGSSTDSTCAAYIWAISVLVVSLLVLITYSCISLFSRRSYLPPSIKNDQHFPAVNSRAQVRR